MGLRDRLPCVIRSELLVNGQPQRLECRLLDRLGEGGMATVYLAELDGRRVAVKYLSEELLHGQSTALERFVREANLLKGLRHPNIVRIYNLGVDQEVHPFLVMELVEDAKTLATLLEVWRFRRSQSGEPGPSGKFRRSLFPLDLLLPLVRQTVSALAELHDRGIIHRDIKPENVLVSESGGWLTAKLTDLGISKSLVAYDPKLTAEGSLVGTPFYMAPEAVTKCRIDPTTGRAWYVGAYSDLWSLGVMLYELVTGFRPYDAELGDLPSTGRLRSSQERMNLLAATVVGKVADDKFRHRPVEDYVESPNQALVQLIDICLVKDPWLRPPDARALLTLVEMAEREEAVRQDAEDAELGDIPPSIQVAVGTRSEDVGLLKTMESKPPPRLSAPADLPRTGGADGQPAAPGPVSGRRLLVLLVLAASLMAGAFGIARLAGQDVTGLAELSSLVGSTPPSAIQAPPAAPAPQPAPAASKRQAGPGPAPGTQAKLIFRQGVAAFQAGDCRTAAKHMRAIQAGYPAFPDTYRVLGECQRRSGDLAAARESFGRYLSFEGVPPLPPEAMQVVNP